VRQSDNTDAPMNVVIASAIFPRMSEVSGVMRPAMPVQTRVVGCSYPVQERHREAVRFARSQAFVNNR
jgi:hypothetical protein